MKLHSMKLHPLKLYLMKLHSIIKTDAIFMNSENNKTSEPHVLILKLTDK